MEQHVHDVRDGAPDAVIRRALARDDLICSSTNVLVYLSPLGLIEYSAMDFGELVQMKPRNRSLRPDQYF